MSRLAATAEQFLRVRKPGRALTLLARVRMPIIAAERIAARLPESELASASPIVDESVAIAAALPGILDGDVVIKDQLDVAGMRTGVGMRDGGHVAERDAAVVARIRAAGGRIVGKAKMTELGIDGIGTLMHYATPPNPAAPGYVPGGSSTGSAVAVAAGLARYAVGGDGLGSIRIPSAFCGLVGLKPTRTRLPREGIHSPVRTLDAVGPIARTVDDVARLWHVMAGEPVITVEPLRPEVVGVPIDRSLRVATSVWRAFRRMLDTLGTRVVPVELPQFKNVTFLGGMTGAYELASGPYCDRVATAAGRTSRALGSAFAPRDVDRLAQQRGELEVAVGQVLARTPILAMPTTAIPPPALSHALVSGNAGLPILRSLGAFTPLANLCDLPAIAVPCGIDDRNRPLSIMFVGAKHTEDTLLRVARAVEQTGLGRIPV